MPPLKSAPVSGGLGLLLLSGCSDMQDVLGGRDDDEPRTLAFECDNNQDLRVRLSSDRQEARAARI
jgi:hypothetical protein